MSQMQSTPQDEKSCTEELKYMILGQEQFYTMFSFTNFNTKWSSSHIQMVWFASITHAVVNCMLLH